MNRPPPSTHSHCTAFPTLSNKRRKKNVDAGAYVDPAALLAFLESQGLDEGSSSEDFFKSFQRLQTMAEEAMQLTRAVPKRVGFHSPPPSHRIQLTGYGSVEDSNIHSGNERYPPSLGRHL